MTWDEIQKASRPTRACGLKLCSKTCKNAYVLVAPHAGVWIETQDTNSAMFLLPSVAPHAGVWIETSIRVPLLTIEHSRAPRGRVD